MIEKFHEKYIQKGHLNNLKAFFLGFFLLFTFQTLSAVSIEEQFKQKGYVEIHDEKHGSVIFDTLYAYFNELIEFFQSNPFWAHKLYDAKERFIRSKDRNLYSTDFFGFYDESEKEGRNQVSFYYSTHFHEFICSQYPEFKQISAVIRFFEACNKIQEPYTCHFEQTAAELGIETIFYSTEGRPPILFKVIKYFPLYAVSKPHYDGTAFSLFLDSTDNKALFLSPYKSTFTVEDFSSPLRKYSREPDQNSIVLIPGALLTEFSLYPTPHIVLHSGKVRYATIAFAMRPHHTQEKIEFSLLPNFRG